MIEKDLEKNILKLINDNLEDICLIDIFNDSVISYVLVDGVLTVSNKVSFTNYIEELKQTMNEQYFKTYMNAISISKIEEEKKNGNEKIIDTYSTLNNKTYTISSMLISNDSNNFVLVLRTKNNLEKVNNKVEEEIRFNSLIDSLSDSIIKVQNIFNLDKKSLSNIDKVEDYINSVFSVLTSNYPELKKSLNKTYANVTSRKEDVILIIDDDMITRNMIKKVFDDTYKMVMLTNGKEALDYLEENENKGISSSADHIIGIFLDLTMPVLDGFAVLEYLSKKNYLTRIPVIIISGDYEKETKSRVYNYNIADMLEKPFDFDVVKHRIGNFINLYKSSNSINDLINNQNEELKELINPFIEAYRYDYKDNILKINKYIKILGNKFLKDYPEYNLTSENISKIADASMYYDVGFYSIPRTILSKNNGFNKEELDKIKKYPLFATKMITYLLSLTSDSLYKEYSINIAQYYHENYDGTGYPCKILGDKIPIEAQISAVCIMYNNLIRKSKETAKDIIISKSGTMFNPKIVESFKSVYNLFEEVV